MCPKAHLLAVYELVPVDWEGLGPLPAPVPVGPWGLELGPCPGTWRNPASGSPLDEQLGCKISERALMLM